MWATLEKQLILQILPEKKMNELQYMISYFIYMGEKASDL